MRRAGWAIAALALLPGVGAGADEPPAEPPGSGVISHSEPGQIPGGLPERLHPPGPFQRIPAIDEGFWVVVAVEKKPYWKVGVADAVLTNACRLGDFATLPVNRMVVRFVGPEGPGTLQVVLPDRRNLLYDRRRLARGTETYYFRDTNMPDCQVWVDREQGPARRLDPRDGTSLPPASPGDLARKRAAIKGWPHP